MTSKSASFTDRFGEAVSYATAAHAGQRRKGTAIPYIYHPVAVSALVMENGGTEDQAIAALLHDVIEHCGPHHAPIIAERFGASVLTIVKDLTDEASDMAGQKPPWRERKLAYLAHLATASESSVLVSAADKLHNALAIKADFDELGESVFDRFSKPRADTFWYYCSLIKVIAGRLGGQHRVARRSG